MDFDLFPSQDMDGCCMDGMMNWLSTGSTLWNDIPFCDNILDDENCLVPPVQTEHSYSMNDNDGLFSTDDQDLDQEAAMVLVNPNLALMPDSPLPSWKTEEPSDLSNLPSWKTEESLELSPLPYWKAEESSDMLLSTVKTEMCDSPMKEDDEDLSSLQSSDSTDFQVDDIAPQPQQSPTFILTYRSNSKLSSRQPTIIVTKMHQPLKTRMLLNKNHDQISNQDQKQTTIHNYSPETLSIKTEDAGLPPSPPNSDTEVTLSPQKTSSKSFGHNVLSDFRFNHHDNGKSLVRSMSTNVPSSDVLIITEEEKRTLIAEGYPVPTKLPLSKQEEKALKKIQRKIKNKMSAQESRKKKKDYLENLEMKSKKSEAENTQLRQKVEHLEHDNRKLVSELQKLRQIIGSYSVQKSTVVMAVVFFFAVCFGIWSPSTFPTYSTNSLPTDVLPASISSILDVNDYITPSKQSRILLSVADEQDLDFKSTSQNALFEWFSSLLVCKPEQRDSETTHVTLFAEDHIGFAQNSDSRNETWKPIGYPEPHTNINLTYTTDFNSVLV